MSTRSKIAAAVIIVGLMTLNAWANTITPQLGGGLHLGNLSDGGITNPPPTGGGGGSCTGTIDLSKGCTLSLGATP